MIQWFTGSGQQIEFDEIVYLIKEHCYLKGKVYVGTDSFVKKRDCIFSSAICLYGADDQVGGRYFVQRYKLKKNNFSNLSVRMLKEAGFCKSFQSYDISTKDPDVQKMDTLKAFPKNYEVCITNPPWLARYAASRLGLKFPNIQYDNIYKQCL